ncbi:hypothetical protein NOVOSPHI9U_60174 [Novosphingobium sp. 9U]|nr:hypothetical protein NOVOSPHI9U_60174 [Novosphingobium sp. 9U]
MAMRSPVTVAGAVPAWAPFDAGPDFPIKLSRAPDTFAGISQVLAHRKRPTAPPPLDTSGS